MTNRRIQKIIRNKQLMEDRKFNKMRRVKTILKLNCKKMRGNNYYLLLIRSKKA
jgi:hypothetical protein